MEETKKDKQARYRAQLEKLKHNRRPLADHELKLLMDAVDREGSAVLRCAVKTIANTGLRISEFCKLKSSNFYFSENEIRIKGKGGKTRNIFIPPHIKELLRAYFTIETKISVGSRALQKQLQKITSGLTQLDGIPCGFHTLRHTYAYKAMSDGVSLVAVSNGLGHSYLSTTSLYLKANNATSVNEFKNKFKGI